MHWLALLRQVIAVVLALLLPVLAQAQELRAAPELPLQGIGRVNAIAVQADGKIVIGGSFSYVNSAGDKRVNLARFNSNGTLDAAFDIKATSTVNALAIVGTTLYVGGDFTGIGGALRNRLASINTSTLAINAWNPDVNGEVFALAASGTTLYVGGTFDVASGFPRSGLAAYTIATGNLSGFDPDPRDGNGVGPFFFPTIRSLAVSGSTLYVGGNFTQIGAGTPQVRFNAGAVDATTGAVTAWDPIVTNNLSTANAHVNAIVVSGSTVYLGGQFTGLNIDINGFVASRGALGAVDATTGAVSPWNPSLNDVVNTLVLDGTTIYAGGEFTLTGFNSAMPSPTSRNHVAAFSTTVFSISSITRSGSVGTATLSAPNLSLATGDYVTIAGALESGYNGVRQITVIDSTHFTFAVGGSPTSPAAGTLSGARNNNTLAFNPAPDNLVKSMALNSGATSLLVGGEFIKANSLVNPAFGGFNKTTGATTIAGNVYDTAAVWALVRQGDGKTILAGDFYMNSGGVLYRSLARLNANDTHDTGWNPVVDGQVVTAALSGNTVLIGGSFTAVGATSRSSLAAVDLTTGLATAFNANVNSIVNTVVVDGTNAYIGGQFTQVAGTSRNFIAQINATTGALGGWYPAGGVGDFVEAIAVDASNVFVGGLFNSIGGVVRLNLAKVSKATGIVDGTWNPGTDEKVFDLTLSGSTLYVSGNFHTLGGVTRNFTGAVSTATTGAVLPWNPDPDYVVLKVKPYDANTVYIAGAFLNVAGWQTGTAAAVDPVFGDVQAWFPILNDGTYDILPDATRVLAGGVFVNSQFYLPILGVAGFSKSTGTYPPLGVFLRKSDGTNASWAIDGPNVAQFSTGFPPGVPPSWQAKGVGDINGDGITDVVWFQPSSGLVAIWLMNSTTGITTATFPASVGAGSPWAIAAVGDMNGDGRADLVWRHGVSGEVLIWYMSATGTIGSTKSLGTVSLTYEIRGVGDFNGDGRDDILWIHPSDGVVVIYLMNANGTFTGAFPGAVGPGSWRPHKVGDFDGDGKADIFWRNEANGLTVVWYMNGGTQVAYDFFISVPIATWQLGRVDDFDFDGRSDLLWYSPTSGALVRWLMQGRGIQPITENVTAIGPGWSIVP